MSKPILLWDFDGVMADSTQFVFSYWRQEMKKAGIDFKLSDYQATFTHKFPFEYLAENYPTVAEDIKTKYSLYEENYYPVKVKAFPNFISNFLEISPNFEHHIISSNLKSVIDSWLKIQGLTPYFKSVVGRETEGYKDEKINHLLRRLHRNKSEALFIGDTISDIEHAQAAGVKNIAVSWGVHSKDQLKKAQPDMICDTIEELFSTLKK
ncbi:HAD family hydrolase [bacterium]|nr:HAD family hydrolase [bacterium]NCQ54813.1 HAD family hydrolase [Candidatus Parcubacteria bacterium]NCS66857.1 HAD family hydrolase [Candidatus Peregrinibacteria bacterium]NCS95803.1 HAD family hydrolase [bacterium]